MAEEERSLSPSVAAKRPQQRQRQAGGTAAAAALDVGASTSGSSAHQASNHAAGGNRHGAAAGSSANALSAPAAPAVAAAALPVQQRQAQPQQVANSSRPGSPDGTGGNGLAAALQLFQSGVGSMQALLQTIQETAQTEQQQLEAARQQLEADRAAFEQETSAVQAVFADSDQVVLNVGGCRFTTTVSTLRSAPSPSLFAAMFSGRHAVVRGADGAVFIDRDGRHFADILNYLRTQQLAYPHDGSDFKYLLELRAEAEYYGLMGLLRLIDRYPWGLTRVVRGLLRSTEDTWVYEDGPDEVVLRVDAPVQLLGVGLAGSDAGYTAELEVLQVAEDFSEEVASLGCAAQSFTKADGPVVRLMLPDPVLLLPERYYMLSVLVKGSESYCCEDCMETVVAGGVRVLFQCWESPNGTSESRGQFPELYLRVVNSNS